MSLRISSQLVGGPLQCQAAGRARHERGDEKRQGDVSGRFSIGFDRFSVGVDRFSIAFDRF